VPEQALAPVRVLGLAPGRASVRELVPGLGLVPGQVRERERALALVRTQWQSTRQ
jgi:hypothetical protein